MIKMDTSIKFQGTSETQSISSDYTKSQVLKTHRKTFGKINCNMR